MPLFLFVVPKFFITVNTLELHGHMLPVMLGEISRVVSKVTTIFTGQSILFFLWINTCALSSASCLYDLLQFFAKHEYPGILR